MSTSKNIFVILWKPAVIRNDILEHFILGYGLDGPVDAHGRAVHINQLWQTVKEKCGDCSIEELLDALFNVNKDHAQLNKFVPIEGRYQIVSFERMRCKPQWRNFFSGDSFRIKVLPAGRVRFQELDKELASARSSERANMKVRELTSRVQKFHDDLRAHFGLWLQSLEQPMPDFPVRNEEKLREQVRTLARQLGSLRPYIERFTQSTVMSMDGQRWDAYDSAVGNEVSVRKGPSIEAVLPQLQQMLGRLELMNADEEVPLESKGNHERSAGTVNIYNLHGSHSRVNIQSEDKSVNVSSITEQQVFGGIREAVSQGVSDVNERTVILEKLEAMQKSAHTKDFISKYTEFVNVVASHMTLIAPFLPALTQMLGQ